MYQKFVLIQRSLLAGAIAMALAPSLAAAANTPEGCLRTVLKEAQMYGQKKANSLRKCEDGVLKGKVTGPCPDAANQTKIDDAAAKAVAKIVKKCDDAAQFGLSNCPRAACAAVLTSSTDLGDCVTCNIDEMVDSLSGQTYGTLESPSADKGVLNCQRTYAKELIQAFRKLSKIYSKCEDGVVQGKIASCPDTKSGDKIAKTLTKLNDKIAKKCPDVATQDAAIDPLGAFAAMGGIAGADTRVDSISQLPAAFGVQSAACGNASIDAGETCDDGNLAEEDGFGSLDSCPADCSVATCSPSGASTATVSIASPDSELIASAIIVVYYDDTVLAIPGSGGGVTVTGLNGFSTTPADADYALRTVILDASLFGLDAGDVFEFGYNECGAPAIAGDFDCFVAEASDTGFAPVEGVTCAVAP